jgi:hypothetical protein
MKNVGKEMADAMMELGAKELLAAAEVMANKDQAHLD